MEKKFNNFVMDTILEYGKVFDNININGYHILSAMNIEHKAIEEIVEIKYLKTGDIKKHICMIFCIYIAEISTYYIYDGFEEMLKKQFYKYEELQISTIIDILNLLIYDLAIKILKDHYKNIIPYLFAILFPHFNIIRFRSPDNKFEYYSMIDLGIKDNFDYPGFINKLNNFHLYVQDYNNDNDNNRLSRNKKKEKSIIISKEESKKLNTKINKQIKNRNNKKKAKN